MEVNNIVPTPSPSAGLATLDSTAQSTAQAGRDTFLRLLIAQLEHQDPMSPMENADFTAQLAQFSALEQLEAMNTNLNSLITAQGTLQAVQASALIDKDIVAKGDIVQVHQGAGGPLAYELMADSRMVRIRLFNAAGQLVQTLVPGPQAAGHHSVALDKSQSVVPDGTYRFEVVAEDGTGAPVAVQTFMRGRVDGVEFEDTKAFLTVGGQRIALDAVTSVKEAGETPL